MGSQELLILLMMLLMALVLWFIATGALVFLYGWRGIFSACREPVLCRPILIIESDDWGAGKAGQASVLRNITEILMCFTDCDGRRPVMTLGMILATADGEKTLSRGSYHRQMISRDTHGSLLDAITTGVDESVFSVQLHGMEHFWPAALLAASKQDDAVNTWLTHSPEFQTEDLPSPLQSRWVDASVLPARRLSIAAVKQAAQEEVHAFEDIFGTVPTVAVPPTFVWNKDVESAWARAGVGVIVTPGCRYETRDEEGLPAGKGRSVYNGQLGEHAIVYLVRDAYFEPSLGHTARQALDTLFAKTSQGRPTLFETHRFNFLGTKEKKKFALDELDHLLRMSLTEFPNLAFLSSEKLAKILKNRDPEWLELRFRHRLHIWITRLGELPRLRKLAWLTGWIVPAGLLWRLTA
ncbi:MAG: glycosyl hydrolase [Gammaproteobacteria bacterium]|nr:glycosyl hydrolase [Gammaproteobacteria bacterium]